MSNIYNTDILPKTNYVLNHPKVKLTSPDNGLSSQQLALIRSTVAKDTNNDEFNMFISLCKSAGLDPFRKQVHCLVFNKDNPKKRQATFIVGIDGYRAIASRSGDYRPDEEAPRIFYDEALKDPKINPLGIDRAEVSVFKYSHGDWHRITAFAFWEEYVPLKQIWKEGQDGRKHPTDELQIAKDNWLKMPKIMIAKCAEAQALRRGWPEDISGTYSADEVDKMATDMVASDQIEQYEKEQRLKLLGGQETIPSIFELSEGLKMISEGEYYDQILNHAQQIDSPDILEMFLDQNREGLKQFWARNKNDALALKNELQKIRDDLAQKESNGGSA
jgi:phage recombination protein Bet